jgi:hypothetical protein
MIKELSFATVTARHMVSTHRLVYFYFILAWSFKEAELIIYLT